MVHGILCMLATLVSAFHRETKWGKKCIVWSTIFEKHWNVLQLQGVENKRGGPNLQHHLIITMLYASSSSISLSLRVINFRATATLVQNGLNADSWEIKYAGQHPKHKCELPSLLSSHLEDVQIMLKWCVLLCLYNMLKTYYTGRRHSAFIMTL